METTNNSLAKAREQAELNCDFVFPKMQGYREIPEDQLPEGIFSPDEVKSIPKSSRPKISSCVWGLSRVQWTHIGRRSISR